MKKILIMGAHSFTGKNMIQYFQNRYHVVGITRSDFDFQDEKALALFFKNNKFDVIINCSAQNIQRKSENENFSNNIFENNLKIFFNIEHFMNENVKLIQFGSGAQYNKNQDLIKVKESDIGKLLPNDQYGYSKYVISKYIHNLSSPHIISPILFGLYGQGEDYTFKFISNAIVKNILKLPIVINQNVIFDYLFLSDFLKIIDYLIQNDVTYPEFNMTPSESIDLFSIAKIINEISNFKSDIIVLNDGLNYQYTGSNDLLMKNLNNQFKFTSYRDGISQLYGYYKVNIEKINANAIIADLPLYMCQTRRK